MNKVRLAEFLFAGLIIINGAYLILIIYRAFSGMLCGVTVLLFCSVAMITLLRYKDLKEMRRKAVKKRAGKNESKNSAY
jgi:hypothetical protein